RALVFVFNHPQSQTVSPEIAEEIEQLETPIRHARASAEFRSFRSALLRLPAPSSKAAAIESDSPTGALPNAFTHPMDYYRLAYPSGWQITRTPPNGAIIAPVDGVQASRNGDDVTHGVMFDLFDISKEDRSLSLEQATNRLIVFLHQRNQSLRIVPGAQTQLLVSDEPAVRTVIIGK